MVMCAFGRLFRLPEGLLQRIESPSDRAHPHRRSVSEAVVRSWNLSAEPFQESVPVSSPRVAIPPIHICLSVRSSSRNRICGGYRHDRIVREEASILEERKILGEDVVEFVD